MTQRRPRTPRDSQELQHFLHPLQETLHCRLKGKSLSFFIHNQFVLDRCLLRSSCLCEKNVDISTGHGVYQFTIHVYPRLTQIVAEASLLFLRPQCCVALPALVGLKEPVPSISVVLETEVPLKHQNPGPKSIQMSQMSNTTSSRNCDSQHGVRSKTAGS